MVNHTQVGYTNFRPGSVAGHDYTAEVAVWLGPRLGLSADVGYIDQRLLDTAPPAGGPGCEPARRSWSAAPIVSPMVGVA